MSVQDPIAEEVKTRICKSMIGLVMPLTLKQKILVLESLEAYILIWRESLKRCL